MGYFPHCKGVFPPLAWDITPHRHGDFSPPIEIFWGNSHNKVYSRLLTALAYPPNKQESNPLNK